MNKVNRNESAKAMLYASFGDFGLAARTLSACIRSAPKKDRNELLTIGANYPALIQHPDFIIGEVTA